MMIVLMEYYYLRESLMQAACYQKGLCKGGSNFDQLKPLKDWGITNGSILQENNGIATISYTWMQLHFWRSFFGTILHYVSILCLI